MRTNVSEDAAAVLTDVLMKSARISAPTPVPAAELRASLPSQLRRPELAERKRIHGGTGWIFPSEVVGSPSAAVAFPNLGPAGASRCFPRFYRGYIKNAII